jgi:hypothetical protein
MINVSFQSESILRFGIKDGDVFRPGSWQLEACVSQRSQKAGAIMNLARLNAVEDPLVDDFAGLAPTRRLDDRDNVASAGRVFWIGPAICSVQVIAQNIVTCRVARRRDVDSLASRQLDAGHHHMKFMAPLLAVVYPCDVVLTWFQARERQLLETIHDVVELSVGRLVFGCERADARRVRPLVCDGIDEGDSDLRIASADDRRRCPLAT